MAVIGAGISGLIAARTLQDHGFTVAVFEKSRGTGGRTATRRAEPGLRFDHGAQYFTARDPDFARYVTAWIENGVVAEWQGRIVEIAGNDARPKTDQPRRYVGTPDMTAMARHLALEVPIRLGTRIVTLVRSGDVWQLQDEAGETHQPCDYTIVSLPAPQAAELLGDHPLAAEAWAVPMTPCWAVLAAFARPVTVPWDGAFVHGSPLAWVARNSSKPGRDPAPDCWVLHASPDWSVAHLEQPPEAVTTRLLAEFAAIIAAGIALPRTLDCTAHRWRYSASPTPSDRLTCFDPADGLALCGDWLAGGRVEGAFRSGLAAAECILRAAGRPGSQR